jgi:hypothetical protein
MREERLPSAEHPHLGTLAEHLRPIYDLPEESHDEKGIGGA